MNQPAGYYLPVNGFGPAPPQYMPANFNGAIFPSPNHPMGNWQDPRLPMAGYGMYPPTQMPPPPQTQMPLPPPPVEPQGGEKISAMKVKGGKQLKVDPNLAPIFDRLGTEQVRELSELEAHMMTTPIKKRKRYGTSPEESSVSGVPYPTGNNGHLKTKFTEWQTAFLSANFIKDMYPDRDAKEALAQRAGLSERQVDNWYQNRRKFIREQTLRGNDHYLASNIRWDRCTKKGKYVPLPPNKEEGESSQTESKEEVAKLQERPEIVRLTMKTPKAEPRPAKRSQPARKSRGAFPSSSTISVASAVAGNDNTINDGEQTRSQFDDSQFLFTE